MRKEELRISFTQYNSRADLDEVRKNLMEKAEEATNFAYAPYSRFCVGSAILLDNGEIIQGSNQENAAYPSGLCAERTAIFYVGSKYPQQKIVMIAVAARKSETKEFLPVSPCGSCRQSMLEYEIRQNTPIILLMKSGEDSFSEMNSIDSLLPFKFYDKNLNG